ncbi:sugar porter family MFS transporter [Occallatibacter riparius]|uniref:Sugar porter family MFS transporter n=1 Tax=Occallatibacter riparius TaxID=1002689 RepID=A0A9J7BXT6_9BACT|nr:sugar porter family MFS transporter [Occallatibacter riparius]UWZ86802.1 sugar porter family MFS transporter [Occallatibacter riparius]
MHTPFSGPTPQSSVHAEIRIGYLWTIAFVAALGGLLFGYDWVVIGGAKPFYEVYFHLTSEASIGWANSCALLGCFVGSLIAGPAADQLGRKKLLIVSALLFAASSVLTGWAHAFSAFILWRVVGGVAIGLASNVSPMYIAEISPAEWRGRLVSLNQLAIVIGILAAQLANWRIAETIPADLHGIVLWSSWNAQYGWRWMFTAVAVPAMLFLCSAPFIPESPRWLAAQEEFGSALEVLRKIGGEHYAHSEAASIQKSLSSPHERAGWRELLASPGRKLLAIGAALAVLQQWSGINVLFNYAQEVYRNAGYGLSEILFNIVITGAINLVFTVVAMLLVDRFGRRRLMIFGCVAIGVSHFAAGLAYHAHLHGIWVLVLTLCAIASYAMSLAPVTWVLITEIFPNRMRASAVSITVACLWIASFVLTYTFPALNHSLGTSGAFFIYAAICFAGAAFVWLAVGETRGRSLEMLEGAAG